MRAKIRAYVVVFVPLLIVSACVAVGYEIYQDMKGDPDNLPDTTVSQTDAVNRVDELVHEVLGLLPSHARPVGPDRATKARVDDFCEIGMEKKRSGQVHVAADYQVFGLASEHFAKYFETVAQYARSKGWTVHRGSEQTMSLWVDVDEVFSVGMRADNGGGFFIAATTTCIWPSGHRSPSAS